MATKFSAAEYVSATNPLMQLFPDRCRLEPIGGFQAENGIAVYVVYDGMYCQGYAVRIDDLARLTERDVRVLLARP